MRLITSTLFSLALSSPFTSAHQHAFRPVQKTADNLLTLHESLTRTPSITCTEQNLTHHLAHYLQSHDFTVELQPIPSSLSNCPNGAPRHNIYAYPSPCSRHTPLLLTSHLDTVPPFLPYFHNNSTDAIHGRGAADAKASTASQITALFNLLAKEEIAVCSTSLLYVLGEETGGDGMRTANSLSTNWSAVIFGEPTTNRLAAGHKGVMALRVVAHGVNGHSGYPWLGVSANDLVVRALNGVVQLAEGDGLPTSEKYGNTTVNIGQITGGVAGNVIAESASAELWIRLAAGTPQAVLEAVDGAVHDATKDVLRRARNEGKNASVEVQWVAQGYGTVGMDVDVDVWGDDDRDFTVNYGTDVPNLKGEHKRYLYGPGDILVAHSDHEAVTLEELERGVEGYERLIKGVLKNIRENQTAGEDEEL